MSPKKKLDNYECPYCNSNHISKIGKYLYICKECKQKFHEYQVYQQRYDESREDYYDE